MVAVRGQSDSRPAGFGSLHGLDARRTRRDALPEHTNYFDTGCEVHYSCLTCPLVRCRYDEPGGTRQLMSERRNRSMVEMGRTGAGISEIAHSFGVSRRTVFRALARERAERR